MKIKTEYGIKKCICGCEDFRVSYKDKSYLMHCSNCGMFCGQRRRTEVIR